MRKSHLWQHCRQRWLPGLLICAAAGVSAAELRVMGNATSDAIATGYGTEGELVGERITEHMGSTGWVPATAGGVGRSQSLLVSAPMATGQLNLSGVARLGDLAIAGDAIAAIAEPDGVQASAHGGIHAEWFTGMSLKSDTLPNGSPVALKVTLHVEGQGVLLHDDAGTNYLLGQFSFSGGLSLPSGGGRFLCEDFFGACSEGRTFTLTGQVGREYSLRGQLDLGVTAATYGGGGIFSNQASVSAGNSAHLYLDLLTPGVYYTLDDSGLQFESAPVVEVPEASSRVMALLGLAFVAAWQHRQLSGSASPVNASHSDSTQTAGSRRSASGVTRSSARSIRTHRRTRHAGPPAHSA